MSLIRRILRFSGYLSLAMLAVIMVFWPFIETQLGKLNKMTTIGIAMAVLAGFVAYFDDRLNQIVYSTKHLEHARLGDALRRVFASQGNHVQMLRIYAITTEVILPIIRDIPCEIDKCCIMLHRFDEDGHIRYAAALNTQVAEIIKKWGDLKRRNQIKSLEIVLYDELPFEYEILLDKDVMISGLYVPNDESPHGNDFDEPVIISSKSLDASKLIEKHVVRFDLMMAYWRNIEIKRPQITLQHQAEIITQVGQVHEASQDYLERE